MCETQSCTVGESVLVGFLWVKLETCQWTGLASAHSERCVRGALVAICYCFIQSNKSNQSQCVSTCYPSFFIAFWVNFAWGNKQSKRNGLQSTIMLTVMHLGILNTINLTWLRTCRNVASAFSLIANHWLFHSKEVKMIFWILPLTCS